ncbi:MAG: AI-2E family transporter [Alphaproteobacteria bacterium]
MSVRSFPLTALLCIAILFSLYFARDVLVPLVLACFLYLVLTPIQRGLERLHLPTSLAAGVIVLSLVGGLGWALYILATPLGEWVGRFPDMMSDARYKIEALKQPVERVKEASEQVEQITSMERVPGTPQRVMVQAPGLLERLLGNITLIAVQFLLILVILYFLLATGAVFREKLVHVMPTFGDKRRAIAITADIQRQTSRYLLTITMINAGLGVAQGTAMYLVGVPNPMLWAMMAFILNFIPYIGALIGTGVIALVAMISFDTLGAAIAAPLVYITLTSIEGQVVTPSVLGRSLVLNPLIIFVSVMFWGWLWGVPGALMAVPLLVVLKAICDNIDSWAPLGEFIGGQRR